MKNGERSRKSVSKWEKVEKRIMLKIEKKKRRNMKENKIRKKKH